MLSTEAFIDHFYRRIVRAIALGTLAIASIVASITLVTFVVIGNSAIIAILAIALISCLGSGLTLFLLARKQPLWQATIPFGLSIIVNEIVTVLLFPELRLAVTPFLSVVVLLAGLYRSRLFSIGIMVVCIVVIIFIVLVVPDESITVIPLPLLRFLQASSLIALLIGIWAFLDQILAAQMQALQLAEQRAYEAENERQKVETANRELEQRNVEQQRLLELVAALELPILQIDNQVLLVPLVGNLDSRRAEQLRRRILEEVAERRAHTVIIDITGITVIDTAVAKALVDTATAIRLLGARTIISGIRPAVAQTLVHLNAGLGDIVTAPNPETALALAHRPVVA